jgi:hypothetical protein
VKATSECPGKLQLTKEESLNLEKMNELRKISNALRIGDKTVVMFIFTACRTFTRTVIMEAAQSWIRNQGSNLESIKKIFMSKVQSIK